MNNICNLHKKIDNFNFGDKRLNNRLSTLCNQLEEAGEDSLSSMLSNKGQLKAYYRFINNPKIRNSMLVDVFGAFSLEEVEDESVILALQDTTELDYTGKRSASNVGCMEYINRRGLYLHNHLLINKLGVPLGLFSQRFIQRSDESLGKSKERRNLPIEEKESYRWLDEFNLLQEKFATQTDKTVIDICDREADISELLSARRYSHIHYIVRSKSERKTTTSGVTSWEEVAAQTSTFSYQQEVTDTKGTKRIANLSVRYCPVVLSPTYRKGKKLLPQRVYLVETKEENPPKGCKPICWRLLTSLKVEDDLRAKKIIDYYVLRWIIERFHYILKQGRKVENLQVEGVEALKNAIVLQSWIALKVATLAYQARFNPDLPLEEKEEFTVEDYNMLAKYVKNKYDKNVQLKEQPTWGDFAKLIAQIGGSSLQKNRPLGVPSLWKGFRKYLLIKETYILFKE